VVVAGLDGAPGAGFQLAQVVQGLGLIEPQASVAAERECLMQAGCGGGEVAGPHVNPADVLDGGGLERPFAEVPEHGESLLVASGRGEVVAVAVVQAA